MVFMVLDCWTKNARRPTPHHERTADTQELASRIQKCRWKSLRLWHENYGARKLGWENALAHECSCQTSYHKNMFTIRKLWIAAGLLLCSCAPLVKLPEWSSARAEAPKVVWNPPTDKLDYASLALIPKDGGDAIAHIESVYTADAVEALGVPEGDRLLVFASPSGNTVAAHENASESSPSEHIAIFSREGTSGRWLAKSVFPPHRDGPVYGDYGVTRGVDDDHLYFHFPDGVLRRVRLSSLTTKVVSYQNQGEEAVRAD
jgi:hypothetical protein